jgi:hypothetical protein
MALARGMQGLEISAARRLNAAVSLERHAKRNGRVFADRYQARVLQTPRATRSTTCSTTGGTMGMQLRWLVESDDDRDAAR